MIEIMKENKQFGIFDDRRLLEQETRKEIFEFIEQKRFFILIFTDEEIKNHPIIKQIASKKWWSYKALVVTINGNGMTDFKDMFHRSSSYVDEIMIPYKGLKKIFEKNEDIIKFFDDIIRNFGEFQVRGMKNVFLREKFRELA